MRPNSFNAFAVMCLAIIFSNSAFGQTITQQKDSVKAVTIKVSGITCGMDLKIINDNVMKQNGVVSSESVGKAAPTSIFEVKYNPAIIPIESIYKIVENSPACDNPDQKPYKVKKEKKLK